MIAHKSFFFAQAWAQHESARPGAFRLLPETARLGALRRDYDAMRTMIFGEAPDWADIVRELAHLETTINSLG